MLFPSYYYHLKRFFILFSSTIRKDRSNVLLHDEALRRVSDRLRQQLERFLIDVPEVITLPMEARVIGCIDVSSVLIILLRRLRAIGATADVNCGDAHIPEGDVVGLYAVGGRDLAVPGLVFDVLPGELIIDILGRVVRGGADDLRRVRDEIRVVGGPEHVGIDIRHNVVKVLRALDVLEVADRAELALLAEAPEGEDDLLLCALVDVVLRRELRELEDRGHAAAVVVHSGPCEGGRVHVGADDHSVVSLVHFACDEQVVGRLHSGVELGCDVDVHGEPGLGPGLHSDHEGGAGGVSHSEDGQGALDSAALGGLCEGLLGLEDHDEARDVGLGGGGDALLKSALAVHVHNGECPLLVVAGGAPVAVDHHQSVVDVDGAAGRHFHAEVEAGGVLDGTPREDGLENSGVGEEIVGRDAHRTTLGLVVAPHVGGKSLLDVVGGDVVVGLVPAPVVDGVDLLEVGHKALVLDLAVDLLQTLLGVCLGYSLENGGGRDQKTGYDDEDGKNPVAAHLFLLLSVLHDIIPIYLFICISLSLCVSVSE